VDNMTVQDITPNGRFCSCSQRFLISPGEI
jgi:hypothetical protein